eukprot:2782299-Pyramimonas_sp.AAC.1
MASEGGGVNLCVWMTAGSPSIASCAISSLPLVARAAARCPALAMKAPNRPGAAPQASRSCGGKAIALTAKRT